MPVPWLDSILNLSLNAPDQCLQRGARCLCQRFGQASLVTKLRSIDSGQADDLTRDKHQRVTVNNPIEGLAAKPGCRGGSIAQPEKNKKRRPVSPG